jgi:prepilin-type N-terminal cleavage/methylation domain-containing protein
VNKQRLAFTLVELLVVIAIIGILMGLLIPAVNAAREAGRKAECANNVRQMALAAIAHDTQKGALPGYVQKYGVFAGGVADPSDPNNYGGTVPRHVKIGTWAVALLPSLDAQPTYEHWTQDRYPVVADGAGDLGQTDGDAGDGFHTLAAPNLAVFQCASNPNTESEYGRNSYVSNNGFTPFRWAAGASAPTVFNGAAAAAAFLDSQSRDNGAFNCKYNVSIVSSKFVHASEGSKIRLEDFKDGPGNTILFSENVQALPWHRPGLVNASSFLTAAATDTEVAFSMESARYINGLVWHYEDPDSANAAMATLWNKVGGSTPVIPGAVNSFHKVNGGGTSASDDIFVKAITDTESASHLARPSSAHVDSVNCGMADGATRSIRSSIDYRVYQALLTPRGKSSSVPWQEFILTDEAIQ